MSKCNRLLYRTFRISKPLYAVTNGRPASLSVPYFQSSLLNLMLVETWTRWTPFPTLFAPIGPANRYNAILRKHMVVHVCKLLRHFLMAPQMFDSPLHTTTVRPSALARILVVDYKAFILARQRSALAARRWLPGELRSHYDDDVQAS